MSTTILTQNLTPPNMGGFRNKVINGAFNVWARGSSRYSNYGLAASLKYRADRWSSGQFQNASFERVSRTDAGPTAQYAMKVTSSSITEAALGTRMALGQLIETVNSIDLAGQSVTMTFWIKFSAASVASYGDFSYCLWEYDTSTSDFENTAPTRQNATTITNGSFPTSWTKYTKTITAGADMDNLAPRFAFANLANTTNNSDFYYEITEVQIERGSIATFFEHRNYRAERDLCKWYYQKVVVNNANCVFSVGQAYGATGAVFPFFISTMRTTPTLAYSGIDVWKANASSASMSALVIHGSSGGAIRLDATTGAGTLVAGNACSLISTASTSYIEFLGETG
jgi:hypothetical protein